MGEIQLTSPCSLRFFTASPRISSCRITAAGSDSALLLWDYQMIGVVVLHWTLVLTLAIGCFIVRVMKGPAYVADAYPLPERPDVSTDISYAKD